MYYISTGYSSSSPKFPEEFDNVLEAMDFADELVDKHAFLYARVVDQDNKSEYTVEDHSPRTIMERDAKWKAAQQYAANYKRRVTQ